MKTKQNKTKHGYPRRQAGTSPVSVSVLHSQSTLPSSGVTERSGG